MELLLLYMLPLFVSITAHTIYRIPDRSDSTEEEKDSGSRYSPDYRDSEVEEIEEEPNPGDFVYFN